MSSYGKLEPQDREERRAGCVDLGPRNRRSEMRVTDSHRIVDKRMGPVPTANSDLKNLLAKDWLQEGTKAPAWDKNSPSALKTLRWSIYELIEKYEGDYGKTISGCLKQGVEELFQEYTHS